MAGPTKEDLQRRIEELEAQLRQESAGGYVDGTVVDNGPIEAALHDFWELVNSVPASDSVVVRGAAGRTLAERVALALRGEDFRDLIRRPEPE